MCTYKKVDGPPEKYVSEYGYIELLLKRNNLGAEAQFKWYGISSSQGLEMSESLQTHYVGITYALLLALK